MKLRGHFLIQLFLLPPLYCFLGSAAFAVFAFHFIPSIDYVMLRLGFMRGMHRKLFHNLFIGALATLMIYPLLGPVVSAIAFLDFLFHIALDLRGRGVEVLYPLSGFRLILK